MCFYEKQTLLQYLHAILFTFLSFLYGYAFADHFFLQKDCNKSTYLTGLPFKGTECWQGPKYKVESEKWEGIWGMATSQTFTGKVEGERETTDNMRTDKQTPPFHVLYSLEGDINITWEYAHPLQLGKYWTRFCVCVCVCRHVQI